MTADATVYPGATEVVDGQDNMIVMQVLLDSEIDNDGDGLHVPGDDIDPSIDAGGWDGSLYKF